MQTLAGRVLIQFYYDIGGEISMEKLDLSELTVIRKAQPKSVRVLAPKFEEAGLKPVVIDFGVKKVENINFNVEAKVYPIGVVEVTLSVDFKNSSFEDIIRLVNVTEGFVRLEGTKVEFEKISGGEEYVEEILQTIEIAKIQLLELKTYDKLLDKRIEKAYGSLRSVFVHRGVGIAWLSKTYAELSRTASDIAELRIEVVDYVHDLRNILKFTRRLVLRKALLGIGRAI